MSRNRNCPKCGENVPAEKKKCPNCGVRVGKVGDDPKHPGSYKGYMKTGDKWIKPAGSE